ncbi:hypothetical protein SAMN05880582_101837 [Rhizobium sp. RU20A]|nr:hypothetical protein SAMN05880582_101837 [Rhizobium sp. RU20A]
MVNGRLTPLLPARPETEKAGPGDNGAGLMCPGGTG